MRCEPNENLSLGPAERSGFGSDGRSRSARFPPFPLLQPATRRFTLPQRLQRRTTSFLNLSPALLPNRWTPWRLMRERAVLRFSRREHVKDDS